MKCFRANGHLLFFSKTKVLVLVLLFLILGGYLYKNFNREHVRLFIKRQEIINSGEKIVFFHIPKTGGSNISANIFDAGYYPSLSVYFQHMEEKLFKKDESVNFTIIRSHFSRNLLSKTNIKASKKILFLRDPKERIISDYYYVKVRAASDSAYDQRHLVSKNKSLLSFLKNFNPNGRGVHQIDNAYVRLFLECPVDQTRISSEDIKEALEYLDTFDFIGFVENYDEDFKLLCDFLYIPKPKIVPHSNTFVQLTQTYKQKTGKGLIKEPVAPEIHKELDRLTKYDYIIYNAAKKIAKEKREKWRAQQKLEGFTD